MYLARAGYSTKMVEKDRPGGQARHLGRIENYPGFPRGITGRGLMDRCLRQALRWGMGLCRGEALAVERHAGRFRTRLRDGGGLESRAVIICTGASFKKLGVPGESGLYGRGIWHAPFARARSFSGQSVAVVGGGETAVHQAIELARHARRVYLLTRQPWLKAHPLLKRRLAENHNVAHWPGVSIERLAREKSALRLRLLRETQARRETLSVDALFVLVGQSPEPLKIKGKGPGLFTAGDGSGQRFRQVAVAGGDGIRAAMECVNYLDIKAAEHASD